ncbi:MAG: Na/Pi cotransporter family protein [Candidatus Velamenicoccus archaeovorus]
MFIKAICLLLGGLGFFFFGMQVMSDGLKRIAGERLKNILHMVTKVPVVGVVVGMAVTFLVQSSSATTVMLVGFVNAGLLVLKQAISVVMGANIGTTITAWIVSSMAVINVTEYALPAAGIGFFIKVLGRTRNVQFWGQVLLGFGMLFLGLEFLKEAFDPLKDSAQFKDVFLYFTDKPWLGLLAGAVFTMILQSSSATTAILQVLAFNGLILFPATIPLLLGFNIGTTITAQLAAIGTNLNARRVAMAHTLFNVVGSMLFMILFVPNGLFVWVVDSIIPGAITAKNIMLHIAVAHTLFNVVSTVLFLPFIGLLEKACIGLVPRRQGEVEAGPQYLEKHLLDTPPIAIEQARLETSRMLKIACDAVSRATEGFISSQTSLLKAVPKLEGSVDELQSTITQYLVDLSQRTLSKEQSEELPVLIHSVNDAERIGDHSENIVELAERRIDQRLPFTQEAIHELRGIWKSLANMMAYCQEALERDDTSLAERVFDKEEEINRLHDTLKHSHVNRLNEGRCNVRSGVVFMDLLDNFEKIGDHLTNIAEGVKRKMRWGKHEDFEPHQESMAAE